MPPPTFPSIFNGNTKIPIAFVITGFLSTECNVRVKEISEHY